MRKNHQIQERSTTKQRKKIFGRNSSLVTQAHNILTDKPLRCDELKLQLVTLKAERPNVTSPADNSSRHNALTISAIDRNVTSDEFLPKHFSAFFTCLSVCISTCNKLQTTIAVQMTGKHNTDENGYAYTESRQHIRRNGLFYVKRLIYKSCPFARQKDTFRHAKAGILKHERTHTAMRHI